MVAIPTQATHEAVLDLPAMHASPHRLLHRAIHALARRAESSGGGGGVSGGVIAGIIIAVLLAIGAAIILIYLHNRRRHSPNLPTYATHPVQAAQTGQPYAPKASFFSKAFGPVQPQPEMYLPQYTAPTQPVYAHTAAQAHATMPGVVYPVQSGNTYYASSQHYQPQGVRFGEVGVRRI